MLDTPKPASGAAEKNDSAAEKTPPQKSVEVAVENAAINLLNAVTDILKDAASQSHFTTTKHKSITEQALIPYGLGEGARFAVEVGDLAQDLDSATRAMPTHHFDDNTLEKSLEGVEASNLNIEKMLSKPKLTEDDEVRILHEFGQRLHTLQDFYSHSNYLELKLKDNPNLRPQQIPLMNFDDIKSGQAKQVHTGFYYYKNSLQNESVEFFLGRTGVIDRLNQMGLKIPGTQYLPTVDYDKLKNFNDRLSYFADQKYSVLHADLNKDDERSDEGKVVDPVTGAKLHEYARDLAVRETKRQWIQFEDKVHKIHGKAEGDKILDQMKNLSFSNGALRSLKYSIDGIITWIS